MNDRTPGARPALSAADIAAELNVSRSVAYEIVRECRHVRFGRLLRVPRAAFDEWLAAHTFQPFGPRSLPVRLQATIVVRPSAPRRPTTEGSLIRPIVPRTKPLRERGTR